MKSSFFALLLLPSLHCIFAQHAALSSDPPISRMLDIKVPGKINSIGWVIAKDCCSVQLAFPTFAGTAKKPASTQVWVLKADGTAIARTGPPRLWNYEDSRGIFPLLFYDFPLSASMDAVAIVVSVDGRFLVETLASKAK